MAILQSIRVKFGVAISIIIALALLSFIIDPGTLQSALQSMSSKYDVGKIAGKSISYQDFQEYVDKYTTLNEIATGSSAQNEQAQKQIRDAAWQELVNKYMFIKNAKAAGINVGEAELVDLTVGSNISPLIAQNQYFWDENGEFAPERVVEFAQAASSDPNVKLYWNYVQNSICTQQFFMKYGALFNSSNVENALTLQNAIAENNTTADVEMVVANYSFAPDSTIKVSSKEIKKYYKDNKVLYKQNASRDIEYVVFEVVPSEKDITATNDKMAAVYDEFAAADNLKSFLLKNSDRSYSEYWYKEGELNTVNTEVNNFVFAKNAKGVSPIYTNGNTFYAARILATANVADSVYVKHILLQGENAKHVADSLLPTVNAKNFSDVAALYSADKGSAADGQFGAIGWMTQTYMIPGLESVITATVNKPYIVKSQYGTHIVLVTKTSKPMVKKQVAILEKTALASKETFNTYYSQANKFSSITDGTLEGYNKALDSLGVYSHKANNIAQDQSVYGTIEQAREITRWAYDNKPGKASGIITVNNNYFFVVALKAAREEGYTPIKDVAAQINNKLYTEKRNAKQNAEVAEKIAGLTTLEEIAAALGTTVSTKTDVTFSKMGASAVEPAALGAIYGAELDKVYGPVQGNMGSYIIKVTKRDQGAFYTEDDARNFAAQMNQYNSNMIIPVMMEAADVKDNRAKFF